MKMINYYAFSFGSLKENDEKKYIKCIAQKSLTKEEEKLSYITNEAISQYHIFLIKSYRNDLSAVSLREIARIKTIVEFFLGLFPSMNKNFKKRESI